MSSSEPVVDGGVPSPRFESQSFGSLSNIYVEEEDGESSSLKGASHFDIREWNKQNAIRLEEKEKREKEILNEIIEEAEEYKNEFYRKWKVRVEKNKASNREKEKLLLGNQEKFHADASKNHWKAAAEMIPREVPTIEKKGKKKDHDLKPSIVVIHGPKPGKPTDLSRMRQVFLKLKQKPPPHMNPPPSTPSLSSSSIPGEDDKAGASSSASSFPPKSHAIPAPKFVTAK